jgi:organic radical activating enzyme
MSQIVFNQEFPFQGQNNLKELNHLRISEFFCDTIQGEGVYTGVPSIFIRLQGCTLNCHYCDTAQVWKKGFMVPFEEIFKMMAFFGLIDKLEQGHHLVFTGGSPLLQQYKIIEFILEFIKKFQFKPFIEIENECTIMPDARIIEFIDCWNNSPKLKAAANTKPWFFPKIIQKLNSLSNSWFKFVIQTMEDWQEIQIVYLTTGLIDKKKIILMPQGQSKVEIFNNQNEVVEIAIKNSVRYTSRLHVDIWDKVTSV